MTTQTWHADGDLLAAYVAGGARRDRRRLGRAAPRALRRVPRRHRRRSSTRRCSSAPGPASATPSRAPPLPLPIRLARRLRAVRADVGRCSPPTASLRTAWLVGAFVALAFATLAVGLAGGELLAPFLLVAPLVPVLGVAAAYGPQQDPLETLVVTAPYGRTRLILLRTLAVLVSVLPVHRPARAAAARAGRGWRPPGSGRRSRWCRSAGARRASSARASGPRVVALGVERASSCSRSAACPRRGRSRPPSSSSTSPSPPCRLVVLVVRSQPRPPDRSRPVNAVELTGVTKTYGRTRALDAVDLTFDRGVTGLLGPNGAGKTTLLRIVATSIAADARRGPAAGPRPARLPRRAHRDPARARLPAAGARLSRAT